MKAGVPVVLAGDYNVAPTEQDIYPTRSLDKNALIQPRSRHAYARLLSQGWTDALRKLQAAVGPKFTLRAIGHRNPDHKDGQSYRRPQNGISSVVITARNGAQCNQDCDGEKDPSDSRRQPQNDEGTCSRACHVSAWKGVGVDAGVAQNPQIQCSYFARRRLYASSLRKHSWGLRLDEGKHRITCVGRREDYSPEPIGMVSKTQ